MCFLSSASLQELDSDMILEYLSWTGSNGIKWNGVNLKHSSQFDIGAHAVTNISNGSVILRVPITESSLLCGKGILDLYVSNGKQTYIDDENLQDTCEDIDYITSLSNLGPIGETLELKLIYEYLLGNSSHFNKLISLLPPLSTFRGHLFTWGKREHKEIKNSRKSSWKEEYKRKKKNLRGLKQLQNTLCTKYQNKTDILMQKLLCNHSLWIWAAIVEQTRAVGVHGDVCIFPGTFFNEGSDGSLIKVRGEEMTLETTRDYLPGEEIKLRYWIISKPKYLACDCFINYCLRYLYVPDWVTVLIPQPFQKPVNEDYFTEFDWEMENDNCFDLSIKQRTLRNTLTIENELIHCFRLGTIDRSEWNENFQDNRPEVGDAFSKENEITAISFALKLFQHFDYGSSTKKEDEILSTTSDLEGIRLIARIRLAERALIDSYIHMLQQKLSKYNAMNFPKEH